MREEQEDPLKPHFHELHGEQLGAAVLALPQWSSHVDSVQVLHSRVALLAAAQYRSLHADLLHLPVGATDAD